MSATATKVNKKLIITLSVIGGLILLFFLLGPFYVIREGEQAVILRFGEAVRAETEPGLKIKVPIIENVVTLSTKTQSWDGDAQRIPTAEQQFIWVDVTARWKISDPIQFYANITTMTRASSRLAGIIDSVVRNVISANRIHEAVRDSNIINEVSAEISIVEDAGLDEEITEALLSDPNLLETQVVQPAVAKGRSGLMSDMHAAVKASLAGYGIEVIDIVIRQIRYTDDLTNTVYERMISDRSRIAQSFRSFGEGRKTSLLGQLENQKITILSSARREAEQIKGQADAEAARIYAAAYGANPEFYNFWRSLESYRTTLADAQKTLGTNFDYFRYLYNQNGTTRR